MAWALAAITGLFLACNLPEDAVVGERVTPGAPPEDQSCQLDACVCSAAACNQLCSTPDQRLCRFECAPTATCMVGCEGGDCVSNCREDAMCTIQCIGGGCVADCAPGSACVMDCPGGNCAMLCHETKSCEIKCPGGNCQIECLGPGPCMITGCDGSCSVDCGPMPCGPPPPP